MAEKLCLDVFTNKKLMELKKMEKVVLTIELNPAVNSSSACGIARKSIESMLKLNNTDSDIVYIGGKKEFIIRYLANLITLYQFEIVDDTGRFRHDEDFSS
jgi:hypothetical protein